MHFSLKSLFPAISGLQSHSGPASGHSLLPPSRKVTVRNRRFPDLLCSPGNERNKREAMRLRPGLGLLRQASGRPTSGPSLASHVFSLLVSATRWTLGNE